MIVASDILQEAVHSHERGEFQRSESLCRQVLRVDPAHHEALYLLGLTAAAQNRGDEAIQQFERLACLCPQSADVHARLAQAYAAAGLLEEAASAYWQAIERRPADDRFYNELGILLHRLGETGGAIACFQQARELRPASSAAIRNLAAILEAAGRRDDAIAVLEEGSAAANDAELHCLLAAMFRQEHRVADATAHYETALRIDADCVAALYELGECRRAGQDYSAALLNLRRATELAPEHPKAHIACGHVLVMLGRSSEALPILQMAVALSPESAEAHAGLGHALRDTGQLADACEAYRRALHIDPAAVRTRFLFAKTLARAGRHREAVEEFRGVQRAEPHLPHLDRHLGTSLKIIGRYDDALQAFERAAARNPDAAIVWYELGNVRRHRRELQPARACYERALRLDPDNPTTLIALGNVLKTLDETEAAAAAYTKVLRRIPAGRIANPSDETWELWIAALCPAVFESSAAIDEYRERLRCELERIAAAGMKLTAADVATSACPVPYHLQFHGRDDLPLKRAYAQIFENALKGTTAFQGRRSNPDGLGTPSYGGRPKIGFVVTAGHEGVFLRYLGGILRQMTYRQFDAEIVCAPSGSEAIRRHLKTDRVGLREIPSRFDAALEIIRSARYDVLYHWEVGSDVTNYFLPFFRLAPVQCTAAGLPVTSGIAAMDYFLSTGFVEPDDADRHYSERLIRGETLLTSQPRMPLSPSPKMRAEIGLSADEHVYLCPHKIEKFHPDLDPLLAEILRRDPAGRLIVPGDRNDVTVHKLRARWDRTMRDVSDRVVVLPHQSFDDYLSLTAAADVLLDPLHYGGGLTAFDGFSLNKPIVTLPGRFVRGRYTFGCYRLMGIDDCIAGSTEDYVEIAVRLGTDADFRHDVERRIAAASDALFHDRRAVAEHEEIFNRLIAEAREA
jgi:protein O-GlcNAc transferase